MAFGLPHKIGKGVAGRPFDIAYEYFGHGIGALTFTRKYRRFAGSEPNCI
jgi:hypothetical protein